MALLVTGDQFGIVEIVTGIHAHASGQAAAHDDFLFLGEKRNLDAINLVGILLDHGKAGFHRRHMVASPPITLKRRVEHFAQPVDHHFLVGMG